MDYQTIDLQGQTIYADLLSSCLKPYFDGHGLSFTKKKIKNRDYWYVNVKLGKTAVQKYLGPCDDSNAQLIETERALWSKGIDERRHRARLVDMYLAAGGIGLTANEGKVLAILERAGVFLTGGVLVGTPAFRALGNNLGVLWRHDYRTNDLDLAADYRYPVILQDSTINVSAILKSADVGAVEIPALDRKHPSTSYVIANEKYVIDILTPEIGTPKTRPVFISQFNTYATPLRFLDYLLDDIEPAVMPYGVGILVNVPNPARFALHKLVISQRRSNAFAIKSKKDINQATQMLDVLFETRPGAILAAFEAAEKLGKKFMQQLHMAATLLPDKTKANWEEWINPKDPIT